MRRTVTPPAEFDDTDETAEEGVIPLPFLVKKFEDALEKEEVERICRIVCENYEDGEFRKAKLYEKLIEAAVQKSAHHSHGYEWEEGELHDEGGLEISRSTLGEIYREIFSSEDLDKIWDECEDIDELANAVEEVKTELLGDDTTA